MSLRLLDAVPTLLRAGADRQARRRVTELTLGYRETLEDAVYGFSDEVQSNALDAHISRLRRKLADSGSAVEIHVIKGVGYLLRAVE